MTFLRNVRTIVYIFSVLAFLTLIITVIFQSDITAHFGELDPFISQIVNTSITGFICLILIVSMYILIDRSEESIIAEKKNQIIFFTMFYQQTY